MTERQVTSRDKWVISIISGLLFLLIASPFLFGVVNEITSKFGIPVITNGCPNMAGLVIHSIVFILIVRLLMM